MRYKNRTLTEDHFNEKVSGKTKVYPCWSFTAHQLQSLSEGEDLICLVSYADNNNFRKYVYLSFHLELRDFLKLNFPKFPMPDFYFIPVPRNKLDKADEIVNDIRERHRLLF